MAKTKERNRAIHLRKQGKSIGYISLRLGVSKSTASLWCRDTELSPKQAEVLANEQRHAANTSILKLADQNRQKRIRDMDEMSEKGHKDVGTISQRDLFIAGIALYWGEGYKRGSQEFGFTNSDPAAIRLILRWLREIYGINSSELILRVSINEIYQRQEKKTIAYWSAVTGTIPAQFTKTSFIHAQAKKIFSDRSQYFGTLRVKVRRSTNLRRRILASIAHLASSK